MEYDIHKHLQGMIKQKKKLLLYITNKKHLSCMTEQTNVTVHYVQKVKEK